MTVKNKESDGTQATTATLDDALLLTGFGAFNLIHMLLTGVILMGMIMQNLAMGYVLPAAQCDLGLSTQQQGVIAAIPFSAMILMSYVWGYLGDTRGRRPVMLYTMLMSMVLTVVTSFMPNAVSFGVMLFLASIFMVATTAICYAFLGEFNNLQHRDKMVTFGSSFIGVGTVALPGIAWLILPMNLSTYIPLLDIYYRPWRLLVVASAAPYVLGCIFLYFSPESPKFLDATGRQEEALEVLKMIYSVNKLKNKDSFPLPEETRRISLIKSLKEQTVPLFKMPLLPWTALICFVQFGIFATTNGFYVWFPTILNSLANYENEVSSICNILEREASQASLNGTSNKLCDDIINVEAFERSIYLGFLFCSMYIIVGFLVDFVGKKMLLFTILVATGACGIGAHLANSQNIAVILFAIFQMSGACVGLMNAVTVEIFPTKVRAMSVCLTMMMGRLGSMLGTNLIGFLLNTHCGLGFYLFGAIVIVNGILCILLPGKKRAIKIVTEEEPKSWQTHEPS